MKIKTRRYYIYYLLKVVIFFLGLVPLKISLKIADLGGKIAFRLVRRYRERAVSNLDDVFSTDHGQNTQIAENVFRNLAKNGAEWIKLMSGPLKNILDLVTDFRGAENLDNVLAEGRGCVLLTFHFGNWELLPFFLTNKGYGGSIVVRRIYFHKYDKFITRLRNRCGVNVIYRDESPKKMLKTMRNGEILGILPDQDLDNVEGTFVDYFGKPAYTPTAPVKMAVASGTKIVPVFVVRKRDNKHMVIVESPIDPSEEGKSDAGIRKYTQMWTSVLERYVRQYPDQWVWVHPRWKTKCAPSISLDRQERAS